MNSIFLVIVLSFLFVNSLLQRYESCTPHALTYVKKSNRGVLIKNPIANPLVVKAGDWITYFL